MKKIFFIVVSVIITFTLCACNSTKLAAAFDKATVETSAKQVINYMNAGDFDGVNAMVREDIKEILTSDVLTDAAQKTYGKAGSFEEYKKVNIVGKKDKDSDYAIALVQAKYEKKTVTFTISFDSNMAIVGLYMK